MMSVAALRNAGPAKVLSLNRDAIADLGLELAQPGDVLVAIEGGTVGEDTGRTRRTSRSSFPLSRRPPCESLTPHGSTRGISALGWRPNLPGNNFGASPEGREFSASRSRISHR